MNGYYPMDQPGSGDSVMNVMGQDDMNPNMVGGHSLDDIVNQNSKTLRRQSVPVHYGTGRPSEMETDMRRVSMLEFSGAAPGQLDQFQFDPSTAAPNMDSMMSVGDVFARRASAYQRRRPSAGDLSLDTRLHNPQANYSNMVPPDSYASPLVPSTGLDVGINSPYVSSGLAMNMDMTDPSLGMMNPGDGTPVQMFSQAQFASPMMGSPITQDFADTMQHMPDPGRNGGPGNMDMNVGSDSQSVTPDLRRPDSQEHSAPQSVHSGRPQNVSMAQSQSLVEPSPNSNGGSTPYGPERPQSITPTVTPLGQQLPWTTPPGNISTINS